VTPACHRVNPRSPSRARARKSWRRDYTTAQRAGLVALGAVEVGLAAAAWADLARRDPAEVWGRKWVWALVIVINIVGPLAYFRWGRQVPADKTPEDSAEDIRRQERPLSATRPATRPATTTAVHVDDSAQPPLLPAHPSPKAS
jgi:Phospholipase_D-nuclease N-terminal